MPLSIYMRKILYVSRGRLTDVPTLEDSHHPSTNITPLTVLGRQLAKFF